MSADEARALDFMEGELARPAQQLADVVRAAAVERAHRRGGDRMRGILAAGQWLGQIRDTTPITRESYYPLRSIIDGEASVARRVAAGQDEWLDPRATDVTSGYAQGVADMLNFALDPAAPAPIELPSATA
ncbi:hypothetical protein E1262_27105 [Jiangella aurantiaca]|uniref:Uncharacterized protein n=1 Tax=Jiangella aurantiaca TaxID=2530373 RepID=A0A4R5A5D7_9ACTN|nr:hypothetical protein [Jiangella aurantiaca]TDD64762.1 hypothetical protein E1262_27105 [Jiangella aurantiaca]